MKKVLVLCMFALITWGTKAQQINPQAFYEQYKETSGDWFPTAFDDTIAKPRYNHVYTEPQLDSIRYSVHFLDARTADDVLLDRYVTGATKRNGLSVFNALSYIDGRIKLNDHHLLLVMMKTGGKIYIMAVGWSETLQKYRMHVMDPGHLELLHDANLKLWFKRGTQIVSAR